MKKISLVIALCSIIITCKSKEVKGQQMDKIPGSYVSQPVNSPLVKEAYDFLKAYLQKEKPDIQLGKVVEAGSQVVAGYNVRLVCEYTENGSIKKLEAIVYTNERGEKSISHLKWL
ncbi:MAG: hypothetical protein D6767_11145 [Candidatus Hydrogenedentota bacterium]|nr:MAG: hypothetical protein D6767_11145 [Candidatus Hydrogenedentota bacterium]